MNRKKMHIHLMGICGTGMTSLASLLKDEGHRVTGSDQNVYPPMSTQLEKLGIPVCEGYRPENLHPKPDLVVIGNVITKKNPEAEEVLRQNLPYLSMPQALAEFFLKDRTPIVIAGTHGKTTLSTRGFSKPRAEPPVSSSGASAKISAPVRVKAPARFL
jgi:UDP-N-acetylmuramate: L-alanyl-gamma-D-glutamyl-meso-diaminopimelate ligase